MISFAELDEEKKEGIWLSPMTNALTPTENSKKRDTQKSDNTNTLPKSSITQRLRTDWDLSIGVSTATQLVVLNWFKGSQPFH